MVVQLCWFVPTKLKDSICFRYISRKGSTFRELKKGIQKTQNRFQHKKKKILRKLKAKFIFSLPSFFCTFCKLKYMKANRSNFMCFEYKYLFCLFPIRQNPSYLIYVHEASKQFRMGNSKHFCLFFESKTRTIFAKWWHTALGLLDLLSLCNKTSFNQKNVLLSWH